MKSLLNYFLAFGILVLFQHCGNEEFTPSVTTDVYVGGQYKLNDVWVPAYWKNGNLVTLSSSTEGTLTSLTISNDEIYAAGSLDGKATYWRNSMPFHLLNNSSSSQANAIYVSDGSQPDVIVTGSEITENFSTNHYYWKNGIAHQLDAGSAQGIQRIGGSSALAVNQDNIYIAGTIYGDPYTNKYAAYWKNGVVHMLEEATTSYAEAIFVEGSDIYVAGQIYDASVGSLVAAYWKNSMVVKLNNKYSGLNTLKIINGEVYAGGFEVTPDGDLIAVYWKNGNKVTIGTSGNGASTIATSIEEKNGTLYIMGYEEVFMDGQWFDYSLLWKNNKLTNPFSSRVKDAYGRALMLK